MHRREMCQGNRRPITGVSHAARVHSALEGKTDKTHKKHQTTHTDPLPTLAIFLDVGVVGDRGNGLGDVVGQGDGVGRAGASGLALQVDVDALLLSLTLLEGVLLDTVDELLTGTGVLDVLDADVDALLDVAVVDALVQEDTDRGLGHVVDNASLAVEDLVGHTIQKRSVIVFMRKNSESCREICEIVGFSGLELGVEGKRKNSDCTDPFWTAPLTFRSTMSPTL